MHAFEIPNLRFSVPASGAVKRYRFVALNASGAGKLANATDEVVGVSMNETTANNQVLEVATGLVMVEANEAIEAGAKAYSNADGKLAKTGTVQVGVVVAGAGAQGVIATVKVN